MIRKAHRWIGLFVSLQLLAWTLGGIWFSWNDIDNIHGDHLIKLENKKSITKSLVSPQLAIDNISDFHSLNNLQVIQILDNPVYKINYIANSYKQQTILIDASSGKTHAEITKQNAIQIAKSNASFDAEINKVELITETSSHHEYREKPLPAWAITFDYPSSPTFYVSTKFGTVNAVRHNSWRIFDFFWMLHTMDYYGRDNFSNWFIKIFSIIALITALLGIALFFISRRKFNQHNQ